MFRRLNLFFFSLILNGEPVTVFYVDLRNMSIALLICIRCSTLGTLRYGDYGYYGLRTGGTLGLGRDICVLLSPPSQAHDGA